MTQNEGLFGDSPFYQSSPLTIQDSAVTSAKTTNPGPDQKTLDDWHYRLTQAIEELRDVRDPIDVRRDLEDVANGIHTYLKG